MSAKGGPGRGTSPLRWVREVTRGHVRVLWIVGDAKLKFGESALHFDEALNLIKR